jgi:uncharacterized protein with GYD domain
MCYTFIVDLAAIHHIKRKGGFAMPYFIILSNLTDEGRRTIKQKPGRIVEVNKEIEAMGVKVHKQYALLGMYDFINIVEAPDNETVMKMSVEIGSRGSVTMTTLPALPVEEFIKKIK